MSFFTLFMFVLGLSASIYILISAMSRIIARKSNERNREKIRFYSKLEFLNSFFLRKK